MKLAVLAYIPGPHFGYPLIFQENLARFKTRYPLVKFSHHDWPDVVRIGNPEMLVGATDSNNRPKPYAISNLIYLTALRIAQKSDITHMLFIEPDSRVGKDYWDEILFEEFFNWPTPAVLGGTMMAFNPANGGLENMREWHRYIHRFSAPYYPIPAYGNKSSAEASGSCIFVNGSISILDVSWADKIFDLGNTVNTARTIGPWDMEIGNALWKWLSIGVWDAIAHFQHSMSLYGDVIYDEAGRLKLLRDGTIVATHQVKSPETV